MGHILIVDDDEISRVIVGRILQDAGYEVAYAGDGSAALSRVRRHSFDIVITDPAMPEMNGLRPIQHLAELDGGTPVIAISGENAEQLLLVENYGAAATLFKPVDPDRLLAAVDRLYTLASSVWNNIWNQSARLCAKGPGPQLRGKPYPSQPWSDVMHVGILSDIHDALDNLERALALFRSRGIETLFFLGDFCSPIPSRVLGSYPGTVHCVFGNGDGDRFAIRGFASDGFEALVLHGEWAEVEVGGRRAALTHYPFYAQALARTGDYDAVFHGHTHERAEARFGDVLSVNPGEVLGWRGRPSVAVWDTDANRVDFLELTD